MSELASKHAISDGTVPRLTEDEAKALAKELPRWSVEDDNLVREVRVKNFRAALALINTLGEIAEEENHHPDLLIHRWNHVRIELYTHTVQGLSENDFILAAKFERVLPAS